MKDILKLTGLGLILLFLTTCSDVLEKDLEDDQVQLKAPANNLMIATQAQTFWWDEFDEVIDGYRLEIVHPNFDSIVTLVLREEIIEGTTFEQTLAPGKYQWSVVAFNSSSETAPSIFDLTISGDSSINLSNQVINLVSPIAGFSTSETDFTFLWQTLSNATDYKIQIASPDFSNSTFIIEEQTIQADSYSTSLMEGAYKWRVRGENEESITPFSERSFSIDQTAPLSPVLTSPEDGDTLSLPINLSWQVDAESVMDTLYVFEDEQMTMPVLQVPTTNTTYLFNENISEVYFWRVRSIDEAGNVSAYSELREFYVE